MIRILLADDHKVLRDALTALLNKEPDIKVVAAAGDGETVLKLVPRVSPDVVIMDIAMAGMNGSDTTRRLIEAGEKPKILALSSSAEKHCILRMLSAGASGYVVKSSGRDELLRGIHRVVEGKIYLCPATLVALGPSAPGETRHDEMQAAEQLGRREREVLQLLAEGNSSSKIAAQLHIATSTVDVHRRNIMRKLNLHNVAELTKHAIRMGLTST